MFIHEDVVHLGEEGVLGVDHDVLFEVSATDLFSLDQNIFPENLDCVELFSGWQFGEEYSAKRASTECAYYLEVLQGNVLLLI